MGLIPETYTGIEQTTNYKKVQDFSNVDAVLQESDQGLRLIQKYPSITSTTSHFKTDRGTIMAKKSPPTTNANQAVSPASGFTIPEHHQP